MEPKVAQRRKKSPESALASLMRLCARSEKSTSDAKRLLRNWGVDESAHSRIIAKLISDRFIDDERYASAYVREKSSLNGWGERKIRAALRLKGIEDSIISKALGEINSDASRQRLQERLQRKAKSTKSANSYELRTKLIRYGLSLGFSYELVGDCVTQILKDNNTECDTFFD